MIDATVLTTLFYDGIFKLFALVAVLLIVNHICDYRGER